MTPEEGNVSTRGLVESDIGPLRRFTGILDSLPQETKTYGEGEQARDSIRISINSKDIDVKEAVEPYHFPTYTIPVTLSNRKKSKWGVLSEGTPLDRSVGFNNVADQQYTPEQLDPDNPNFIKSSARMEIKDCIGKRIGWVVTDGEDGRPKAPDLFDGRLNEGKGADTPTPTWTVYEIEGIGVAGGQGVSAVDLAESILDGKALNEFNSVAMANPIIRADTPLLQAISKPPTAPDSFANSLVTAGRFTVNAEGIYHKV